MINTKNKNFSFMGILKFLIPSLIGIFIFMIPLPLNGSITVVVAFLSKSLQSLLNNYLTAIMTTMIVISAVGSIYTKIFKPKFILNNNFLNNLFNISPIWFISRIIGAILAILTYFQIGTKVIYSADTGGTLLFDLLPTLFSVFLFAGLLLPLILDFGLLEFFGTLLSKVMRPLFKLPGRSSVDCIASWVGDGTVGILLTNKQYEQGYYTKKEASIIGTNFSVVSITFSLVVLAQVGLSDKFLPFYLTITIAGVVAAIIMPRIPPLSIKKDEYISDNMKKEESPVPPGTSTFKWSLLQAINKANNSLDISSIIISGFKNVFDLWIGVTPIIMAFGTIALIIANYTPLFQWLSIPFIPLLNILNVPEATAAAPTLIVGFADMFLPSILAANITSDMTRFIIASVSVTQLVYMSEVGGLLLGSKIPIKLLDLIFIFILRTLITLPIIVLAANLIF